jgi:hypothetical protein
MGYGTDHMTTTTAAVFVPEVWTKRAEIAREKSLVMSKRVLRKDSDVSSGGDTDHIPFASNLDVNPVSDQTEVTFQSPTETEITITLNRHYESSFVIQDKTRLQSKYDLAKIYPSRAGYAVAKQMDTDLTGLYSGLSQSVGDGSTNLTEANLVLGLQYLDDADAPEDDRSFVVKPAGMTDLRQIARFTEYQTTGNNKAPMVGGNGGYVGNIYGVPVFMSGNIQTVAGTPSVVHNLLFHRDAFALAVQKSISLERERRASYLSDGFITSALWGYTDLRDDHAVDVRCAT